MLSQPVVLPNALEVAITSSPKHLSRGGPMDSIYKSYVFLIQSGFGYYYTWSPFYNPNGDGARLRNEAPSPERGPPSPPSTGRPPATSRELALSSEKDLSSHLGAPKNTDSLHGKTCKTIHLVRSPFTDLPPVRAVREFAPPQVAFGPGAAEDPIALWLKLGALDKLEQALLDGYWEQLVGKTSRIPQVSRFLRQVPRVQARIEEIHENVAQGRLEIVKGLIEFKKFAYCRDQQGATPLHKAVLYNQADIIAYFLERYPSTLHVRDHQGRTPLHYAAVLEDGAEIYNALLDNGADENATDVYGHTPTFYLESDELSLDQLREGVRRSARHRENLRRNHENRVKHRNNAVSKKRSFSAKRAGNRSQVREMIQQGNLEILEEMVLHGHGDKLLGESATNPVVQEFLDTVPGYMQQINDVHGAVVRGRLTEVQTLISHKSLSLARDVMGFTPLHKAVLYGHFDIVKNLSMNFPQSMAAQDLEGRTPLHLAAGLRDGQKIYDCLIFAGSPTNSVDSKGKTAEQYLKHPELLAYEQTVKKNQLTNATHLGNTNSKLKFLSPNVTKSQSALHDRLLFTTNFLNYERSLAGSKSSESSSPTPPSLLHEDGNNNFYPTFPRTMEHSLRGGYSRGRLPPVDVQGELVTSEKLREWIESQNVGKLREAVLSGIAERVARKQPKDKVIQAYLKHEAPNLIKKFDAIHRALQEGDVPELESQMESQDFALARDHFGMTPLHRAVILRNVASVKFLVNKFPETINARDRGGCTALHFAAAISRRTGKSGIFRYLVQNGADARIRDSRGRTAEYNKSHHLPMPSEAALLRYGRKLRSKSEPPMNNGFRSQSMLANQISERITTALQEGSVPLAKELVMEGYGRHLIARTSWNEELRHYLRQVPTQIISIENLHRSVENGDLEMVIKLANRDDALLRARDENGYQAIHVAVVNRQPSVVEYIANIYPQYLTAKATNGRQPLHLAALQKDTEIYRLLVNYGADVRALDARGRTAEFYMRSAVSAKNLATNPNRFYEDHPRRMGAAPLPALGSAFSRKSMPDVNQAVGETRTRSNSESSVISDQDDHQNAGDKDEVAGEEVDSGNQRKKNKIPEDELLKTLEKRPSAEEPIQETMGDVAKTNNTPRSSGSAWNEDEDDIKKEDKSRASPRHREEGANEQEEVEEAEEASLNKTSFEGDEVSAQEVDSDPAPVEEPTPRQKPKNNEQPTEIREETANGIVEEELGGSKESEAQRNSNVGVELSEEEDLNVDEGEGGLADQTLDADSGLTEEEPLEASVELDNNRTENEENTGDNLVLIDESSVDADLDQKLTLEGSESNSFRSVPRSSLRAADSEENFNSILSAVPEGVSRAADTELLVDDEADDVTPTDEFDKSEDSTQVKGFESETDDNHREESSSLEVAPEKSHSNEEEQSVSEVEARPGEDAENLDTENEPEENGASKAESGAEKQNEEGIGDAETQEEAEIDIDEAVADQGGPGNRGKDGATSGESVEKPRDAKEQESAKVEGNEKDANRTVELAEKSLSNKKDDNVAANQNGSVHGTETAAVAADDTNERDDQDLADNSKETRRRPEGSVEPSEGDEEAADFLESEADQAAATAEAVEETLSENCVDTFESTIAVHEGTAEIEDETVESIGDGSAAGQELVEGDENTDVQSAESDEVSGEDDVLLAQERSDGSGGKAAEDDVKGPDDPVGTEGDGHEATEGENEAGEADPTEREDVDAGAANSSPTPEQPVEALVITANDEGKKRNTSEPHLVEGSGGRGSGEASNEDALPEAAAEAPVGESSTRALSESKKQTKRPAMDRLDELIDYWINEEDLLRLEHVVIAGQGDRLIGKTSANPHVQEFINLVPTYMEKIREVQQAVIKGDERAVKELLTRKRFALSRDAHGASPLHLSILYGHLEVLKYIVEFFPETLDGPDNEGRTPLHYAAVAPVIDADFYQLLREAGADINMKDKNGNSAEFYRTHPGALTIEDIFRNYRKPPNNDMPPAPVEKPQTPPQTASNMNDVKQEVRGAVTNMIRELNSDERGYVGGSGVEAVLIDALIVVCAKRPSTPVSFLGDYLLSVSQATPRDTPKPGAVDVSVKTDSSLQTELTNADAKLVSTPKAESKPKPKRDVSPVQQKLDKESPRTLQVKDEVLTSAAAAVGPTLSIASLTASQAALSELPATVASSPKILKLLSPSEGTPMLAAAPQTPSTTPEVASMPSAVKVPPSIVPSPLKVQPTAEATKPVVERSTGPPLVAPMLPLGTAPLMSSSPKNSLPSGMLNNFTYKDDLFEDNER